MSTNRQAAATTPPNTGAPTFADHVRAAVLETPSRYQLHGYLGPTFQKGLEVYWHCPSPDRDCESSITSWTS